MNIPTNPLGPSSREIARQSLRKLMDMGKRAELRRMLTVSMKLSVFTRSRRSAFSNRRGTGAETADTQLGKLWRKSQETSCQILADSIWIPRLYGSHRLEKTSAIVKLLFRSWPASPTSDFQDPSQPPVPAQTRGVAQIRRRANPPASSGKSARSKSPSPQVPKSLGPGPRGSPSCGAAAAVGSASAEEPRARLGTGELTHPLQTRYRRPSENLGGAESLVWCLDFFWFRI